MTIGLNTDHPTLITLCALKMVLFIHSIYCTIFTNYSLYPSKTSANCGYKTIQMLTAI